nr:MAG TPA: hypothetical protein [Inoviridae sp.]
MCSSFTCWVFLLESLNPSEKVGVSITPDF